MLLPSRATMQIYSFATHPYPIHSCMRLYLQSREFQRAKMRFIALQILKIRCKGNNFYANQHYFTTIISLSDSGVCPKPTADAPCSDVAHHSAAPRCGAYPSSLPAPDAVRGLKTCPLCGLTPSHLSDTRHHHTPWCTSTI